ncbi:MAG TPA: L-threonylcarbamoyladenylate synthase [Patescibacteria group bacterium]|jgi:L-threonylcarbamoyladenylate synthase|nr:L-threonylcarbamoyladenylate synthase [Patescibacteria group bacterium]
MNSQINEAVKVLNRGGIIIFPTDTAFGIGCRADDEKAIQRLFRIRNRPSSQAVPVLFDSIQKVKEYVLPFDEKVQKLMNDFWPGALTIVLNAKTDKIPILVRGGRETVGVRIPNHSIILEIIKNSGIPVLGPSANLHGENTPFELKDLEPKLVSLVDYVVKGECSVKQASTVVDCTKTPWKILRQGAMQVKI